MRDLDRSYLETVMEDFSEKRNGENLSIYLNSPSPENVKSLALYLLSDKSQLGKDARIVNNFLNFNPKQIAYVPRNYDKLVKDIGAYKKYKRISQFISRYQEDPSHTTAIVNVDFIAWLIDFKPRPLRDYEKEVYVHSPQHISNRSGKYPVSKKKIPKPITRLEIKKEDFEDLLANFNLPKFEKLLGELAQRQLRSMLEDWKEKELIPLFENLIEERLLKLDKKIRDSKRAYGRFGILGLLFINTEDNQLLFEQDLFQAIETYRIDIVSNHDIDDSLLESISELGS